MIVVVRGKVTNPDLIAPSVSRDCRQFRIRRMLSAHPDFGRVFLQSRRVYGSEQGKWGCGGLAALDSPADSRYIVAQMVPVANLHLDVQPQSMRTVDSAL